MLLIKNFLGYLNDSWAGTYSQQLARMGSRKTNFLCTPTDKHVLSKEMFWMKTKTVIWFSFHMICETFTRILQPYNIRVAYKPITTLWRLLTNVKDKDKPEDRQGASSIQNQMFRLPGFLHWWNRQKPKHVTDRTQTRDEEWWRQQSHCWAPFKDETSNWLGLCDMYNVFYRLLSTSYFRKLVY